MARMLVWQAGVNQSRLRVTTAKLIRMLSISTVFRCLRFNYKWSDYEVKQAKHMQDTFEEIIHSMGGIALGNKPGPENSYGLEAPGKIIHEVGTARMGNDPKNSVLNKYQQAHDVKNLFVVDAAPFPSQGDKNVTWTILASSMRTSEYLIDQVKKKNI
jgi:choline dehydrogenase-like flavoprotein